MVADAPPGTVTPSGTVTLPSDSSSPGMRRSPDRKFAEAANLLPKIAAAAIFAPARKLRPPQPNVPKITSIGQEDLIKLLPDFNLSKVKLED
jgi:hypothetical protein